jgi:hypothetical protein
MAGPADDLENDEADRLVEWSVRVASWNGDHTDAFGVYLVDPAGGAGGLPDALFCVGGPMEWARAEAVAAIYRDWLKAVLDQALRPCRCRRG